VLLFLTGRGDVTTYTLERKAPEAFDRLTGDDLNIVFHNRVNNLKKIYPYIPEKLNRVLMHFAVSAPVYYEETQELLDDLGEAGEELRVGS
jgi:hypothetical protein